MQRLWSDGPLNRNDTRDFCCKVCGLAKYKDHNVKIGPANQSNERNFNKVSKSNEPRDEKKQYFSL